MVFICPFTFMELNAKTNIKLWEKKINFETINETRLNYFDLSDKKHYLTLIKFNLNNPEKMQDIYKSYKENQIKALNTLETIEKEKQNIIIKNNIHIINENIMIRLLSTNDILPAIELYKEYNKSENIKDLIEDYILKNEIHGIFNNEELKGCVIHSNKKFKIDNNQNKIDTFYIQELFINDKNNKYGGYLFNFIINKCPDNVNYISFMTKPDNKAMYRIAEKNKFILQETSSGDIENPSLFILNIKN